MSNVDIAKTFVKTELDKCPEKLKADGYYRHCMSIFEMIQGLNLPFENHEMDVMLAATICHVIPEVLDYYNVEESFAAAGLEPGVAEIVRLITRSGPMNDEAEQVFYDRILENKFAYMIRLVDRSNLIEQLCVLSPIEGKEYLLETKKFILPMCICGKEKYPELTMAISILMEKMRSLIQVLDVLFSRYDTEEASLNNEILNLKEENSRLRGMISSRS